MGAEPLGTWGREGPSGWGRPRPSKFRGAAAPKNGELFGGPFGPTLGGAGMPRGRHWPPRPHGGKAKSSPPPPPSIACQPDVHRGAFFGGDGGGGAVLTLGAGTGPQIKCPKAASPPKQGGARGRRVHRGTLNGPPPPLRGWKRLHQLPKPSGGSKSSAAPPKTGDSKEAFFFRCHAALKVTSMQSVFFLCF